MEFVRFEELPAQTGKLGLITLTRPKALNALNLEMIQALTQQLKIWATTSEILAIIIKGEGERAFCAGGDIRALYAGRGQTAEQIKFFDQEYRLNKMIGAYPKPYISLLHGVVMGGGAGISLHGSHRVACESLVFAMPETGIGLFPDIGASHFLTQAPGMLGRYLGLSGARINVADAVYAGFVDHCISSNHFSEVIEALQQAPLSQGNVYDKVTEVLAELAIQPDESSFAKQQDFIDGIFCGEQVTTILDYLSHDDGEWSQAVYAHLQQKSPMSLSITLKALQRAQGKDLTFSLEQDFCMVQTVLQANDLYEGIRATVIDKDMKPSWQPAKFSNIDENQLNVYFSTQGKAKLDLL